MTMPAWEDDLRRWLADQPAAPAPIEEPVRPPNWKAELLREANFGWAPEAPPAAPPAVETPVIPAYIPPRRDLPRPYFTRHGYEPGQKPPSKAAMQDLIQQVYGATTPGLIYRMVADTPLFGALDTWRDGDLHHNHKLLRILFDRISAQLGDAYGFKAAPLGKLDHSKHFLGYYAYAEQAIFLSAAHLTDHPAHAVNTIAHEQAHRLQDLLVQAVTYRRKLSPPERSLALWWYDERTYDHRTHPAEYHHSLKEWHARQVGNSVAAGLGRVFGWPTELSNL
ncbi:MAG: hypothetical protein JWM80_6468 [Cyanobacteria bacterium RYN_339]|nr:hypothetical protein [Cyanobacteria bacterium RYN_339]